MLKLKHLYENYGLAKALIHRWEHDEEGLDALITGFRISSNAIYPFSAGGNPCYLRCAPVEEKLESSILAELEFIGYLRSNGYRALRPIPALSGELLIRVDTQWGAYYASAFEGVCGKPLTDAYAADGAMLAYGRAMGRLHGLSRAYRPRIRRPAHGDILEWIRGVLGAYGAPRTAFEEAERVRSALLGLDRTPQTYGLVHYDFELDNVFFDESTGTCAVIDFDDAMYHWYAMDLYQALVTIEGDLTADEARVARADFLKGYAESEGDPSNMLELFALMDRFSNIYHYARLIRSVADPSEAEEPDWLVSLRSKLTKRIKALEQGFGEG